MYSYSYCKVRGQLLVIATLLLLLASRTHAEESYQGDSLSAKEKELVAELRPMVADVLYKDYMSTDEYLVRFLRVRNNELGRAKELIGKTMAWRKDRNIDSILTEDFSLVENEYPLMFEGFDNEGRPLVMGNIGAVDVRKIVVSGQIKKFLRFFEAGLELAEAVLREMHAQTGFTNISRAYSVLDLNGFNLRQHTCAQCIQLIPHLFTTYENYYPDRFFRFYAINTPKIALPFFDLVRPFLSGPSKAAVKLFDHNSDVWKKVLLSEIGEDQLAKQYGGSRNVVSATLAQLRKYNPYVKAAFERAFREANLGNNADANKR